ncbi:MAG: 30S ribosomal protein S1 [Pyrinomonadaceae bacterium]
MTNEANQPAEESETIEKTAVEQSESTNDTAAADTSQATATATATETPEEESPSADSPAEDASAADAVSDAQAIDSAVETEPVGSPSATDVSEAADASAVPAAASAPERPAEMPTSATAPMAPSTAQYRTITVSKPIRPEPPPEPIEPARPAPTAAKAEESGDDAQPADIDFGAILEQFEQEQTVFHAGELVEGKVVGVSDRGVLVDFGYKSEGIVPVEEFTGPGGEMMAVIGDDVEVIIRNIPGDGAPQLSRIDALGRKVWDDIEAAFNAETPITGRIVDKTKGGLRIDINGVEAFMPGSQVDSRPVRGLDGYIGQDIEAQVIKFSRRRNNIVLSRKIITDKVVGAQKAETLAKIDIGTIVDGTIKNLTEYGAFVDIGGIDGLLHVTDMSWGRLHHPGDQFGVGDHIQVKIVKLDREREKISLGYKQLLPDPWSTVVEVYPVNTKIKGTVSSVTDYGVFVELEPGVEGLVHVSEISWAKRAPSPKRMFNRGQEVEVQVLGVDTGEKRISLGMKQFQENPWDMVDIKYPVGSKIQGKVRNLTDFGAFVELEEGIDGLVHVSDITWTKKIKHPKDVLKKDQEVEAIVTSIDKRGQRLSLSMKDLTPSAWEGFVATHRPGDVVRGKVSRFTNFGVFVELEEGLEGLCHISELSDERVERPETVAELGQEMDFKILRIEPEEQKIGLSHRAVGKDDQVPTGGAGRSSGGGGGGGDKMYSTEAKGGMASLGELSKLKMTGSEEPAREEDPEEKKRAKQAAKKAKADEFAAREAEKSAEPATGAAEAPVPTDEGSSAEEAPIAGVAEQDTTKTDDNMSDAGDSASAVTDVAENVSDSNDSSDTNKAAEDGSPSFETKTEAGPDEVSAVETPPEAVADEAPAAAESSSPADTEATGESGDETGTDGDLNVEPSDEAEKPAA